jgi:hypothetical protein
MTETPRITVDELRKQMEAGEDFTVIDVRKPERWQQSDTMIPKAPPTRVCQRAIGVTFDGSSATI